MTATGIQERRGVLESGSFRNLNVGSFCQYSLNLICEVKNMNFYKDHYDVIIMGAGLAGLSCALQPAASPRAMSGTGSRLRLHCMR